MNKTLPYHIGLRVMVVFAWTAVSAALTFEWLTSPCGCHIPHWHYWLGAMLLSGIALWRLTGPEARGWSQGMWFVHLVAGSTPLMFLGHYWPSLMAILLVFPTWFVAQRVSFPRSLLWVLAVMVVLVLAPAPCVILEKRLLHGVIFGGLDAFAAIVSWIARAEMEARVELTRTNAELLATQDLLTSQTRLAERMRVARELHDVLGHRLAALSLHLETAAHSGEAGSRSAVSKAQEQTRSLLADVRGVVSTLRKEEPIDLESALSALTEGIRCPRIHLALRGDALLDDPARAHALVRCVQEIITNTLKHAAARNLWIEVESHPEGLVLKARDDGQGAPKVVEGHGLHGMRERLRPFGGRLDLAANPGEFRVNVWIPAFSGGAA